VVAAVAYSFLGKSRAITLTGIVTTDAVIVSPQVQGRVKELLVKDGDVVQEGQVIATIEADEPQADLAFYKSSERQAAARVAESEANLKYQQALTDVQLRQADANFAAAQAAAVAAGSEAENARLALQRLQELHTAGAESTQAFDVARTNSGAAQAR